MGKLIKGMIFVLAVVGWIFYIQDTNEKIPTEYQFRIYRDEQGIPRIVAEDKLSMFFGMGYANAQDRLWTLFIRKMVLQGRLSELFGAEGLHMDLEMRNFDF